MSVMFGLTSIALTKSIAIALAVGGLIAGLGLSNSAAWFWERTARVPVDPLNGDPHSIMSVLLVLEQLALRAAQFRADQEMVRLNALAARFTAAAVVPGTLSSVAGLF